MQSATKEFYTEAINRAVEYIEANTAEKISLEDIAAYTFISKYHFHRVFKSMIGSTTKEYLTRLRLEKSALLLKNTDKNIAEIAFETGYNSPETFTRAFKDFFSTTPTLYRENIKQEIVAKKNAYDKVSFSKLNLETPKIVNLPDLHLVYIRHFGSYDKVSKSFQRLMMWAAKNLTLKLKPTTLGIVHDNPDLTEESKIRFDACVLVTKEIKHR